MVRQILLDIVRKVGVNVNQLQKEIDEWFKNKFDKLTRIKESFHEMSSCTYENQYTNFGKEREYLIDLHKGILEKGKHETKDLRILIQNIFSKKESTKQKI